MVPILTVRRHKSGARNDKFKTIRGIRCKVPPYPKNRMMAALAVAPGLFVYFLVTLSFFDVFSQAVSHSLSATPASGAATATAGWYRLFLEYPVQPAALHEVLETGFPGEDPSSPVMRLHRSQRNCPPA